MSQIIELEFKAGSETFRVFHKNLKEENESFFHALELSKSDANFSLIIKEEQQQKLESTFGVKKDCQFVISQRFKVVTSKEGVTINFIFSRKENNKSARLPQLHKSLLLDHESYRELMVFIGYCLGAEKREGRLNYDELLEAF